MIQLLCQPAAAAGQKSGADNIWDKGAYGWQLLQLLASSLASILQAATGWKGVYAASWEKENIYTSFLDLMHTGAFSKHFSPGRRKVAEKTLLTYLFFKQV